MKKGLGFFSMIFIFFLSFFFSEVLVFIKCFSGLKISKNATGHRRWDRRLVMMTPKIRRSTILDIKMYQPMRHLIKFKFHSLIRENLPYQCIECILRGVVVKKPCLPKFRYVSMQYPVTLNINILKKILHWPRFISSNKCQIPNKRCTWVYFILTTSITRSFHIPKL